MEAVHNWTRNYFLDNQEECTKRLSNLTADERAALKHNLNFKENGSLVLVSNYLVVDVKEPEFYCEKYELKKEDGSLREESGKYCERINIGDNEICEDPAKHLSERQTCIITESSSNNLWIKEYDVSSSSNKRKIECNTDQKNYLVRVYDTSDILLNQLVEVIGFLYSTSNATPMDTDDFGDEVEKFPPYVIHAITFNEQPHNNPLLFHGIDTTVEDDMEGLRNDIHRILANFLFGDEIAAHYLLCHLISKVYSRVNDEALGKFTLNLICHAIPPEILKEYAQNLYSIIECLVPNSLYIPLTIENLNTTSFVPKKDYTKNKLSSGILQLPKSTHILLDETQLENGKLDQSGCMAISDLSELIRNQQLSYDFQYYKIPYKTDFPVLIVSEGKSLLPSDFPLPIQVVDAESVRLINESIKTGIHCMKPKLNAFRRYLTRCRLENFDIADEETKMIESDFAKIRETNANFQIENLHVLLVLSRLIGVACGKKKLDANSWEIAKNLEFERNARLERRNVANEP